jgi:hypothetical protein
MRAYTPDGWEQPLGTFAQLPNFSAADLSALAEHHATGTLRAFLTEKYAKFPYGLHVIAAIERFYGREDE